MTDDSASWYIPGEGGKPVGPFTAEELTQSWRAGTINERTMCWREGMGQWLPLSQIEPLALAIRSTGVSSRVTADAAEYAASPERSKAPLIVAFVGVGVGLLAIVIVALLMTRGTSNRADKASNYFPDDTTMVTSYDVPALLKNRTYQKFGKVFGQYNILDNLGEHIQGEFGVSPSDISRITVAAWHAPDGGRSPTRTGNFDANEGEGAITVVVLKRAIQPKEIAKKLVSDSGSGDWAEQDVGGHPFYSHSGNWEHTGYFFPDNHTLAIGNFRHLRAVLDRKGPPNSSSRAGRVLCGVEFSHSVTNAQAREARPSMSGPSLVNVILYHCGVIGVDKYDVNGLDEALIGGFLESTCEYIDAGRNLQVAANWTCRDDEAAKKVQINMDGLLAKARADGKSPITTRYGRTVTLQITVSEAFLDTILQANACKEAQGKMDRALEAWLIDRGPKRTGDQATEADLVGKVKYLEASWPVCPVGKEGSTRIAIPPLYHHAVCPSGIPSHARPDTIRTDEANAAFMRQQAANAEAQRATQEKQDRERVAREEQLKQAKALAEEKQRKETEEKRVEEEAVRQKVLVATVPGTRYVGTLSDDRSRQRISLTFTEQKGFLIRAEAGNPDAAIQRRDFTGEIVTGPKNANDKRTAHQIMMSPADGGYNATKDIMHKMIIGMTPVEGFYFTESQNWTVGLDLIDTGLEGTTSGGLKIRLQRDETPTATSPTPPAPNANAVPQGPVAPAPIRRR